MKTDIHPTYFKNIKITCACGNVVIAGSTKKELSTELCSACHPFYTGKQKLVDTAGRVDKFKAKMEKARKKSEIANKNESNDKEASEKETKTQSKKEISKKSPAKESKTVENTEETDQGQLF